MDKNGLSVFRQKRPKMDSPFLDGIEKMDSTFLSMARNGLSVFLQAGILAQEAGGQVGRMASLRGDREGG
jgi:hypothetical protein